MSVPNHNVDVYVVAMVTSALCQEIVSQRSVSGNCFSSLKLRAATHWGTLKSGGLSESERHLVGPIVHIPLTSQRMAHPQGRNFLEQVRIQEDESQMG